jgi:hypothetical protein
MIPGVYAEVRLTVAIRFRKFIPGCGSPDYLFAPPQISEAASRSPPCAEYTLTPITARSQELARQQPATRTNSRQYEYHRAGLLGGQLGVVVP